MWKYSLTDSSTVADIIIGILNDRIKIPDFYELVDNMLPYYDFDKGTTPEFIEKLNETIIDYLI